MGGHVHGRGQAVLAKGGEVDGGVKLENVLAQAGKLNNPDVQFTEFTENFGSIAEARKHFEETLRRFPDMELAGEPRQRLPLLGLQEDRMPRR